MAKVETSEKRDAAAEREPSRFDDLWAISDAEIAAGMRTLDLGGIEEETARRRGR